jgi:predicted SAM-dependent methyltransferase
MLSRRTKATFYALAGPLMACNGALYRRFRAPREGSAARPLRVHLGPGRERYLPGWINVDANMFTGKCDVWADLRNPLPFHSATVDAVYSHHMIEHLPDPEGHLKEVHRILKPGGIYRVGGPNGDSAVRMFLVDRGDWFSDWPDKYASIGGRFVNFVFCRNEHLVMLTESFLRELAARAGFATAVAGVPTRLTQRPELFADALQSEHESDFENPHTLILELIK